MKMITCYPYFSTIFANYHFRSKIADDIPFCLTHMVHMCVNLYRQHNMLLKRRSTTCIIIFVLLCIIDDRRIQTYCDTGIIFFLAKPFLFHFRQIIWKWKQFRGFPTVSYVQLNAQQPCWFCLNVSSFSIKANYACISPLFQFMGPHLLRIILVRRISIGCWVSDRSGVQVENGPKDVRQYPLRFVWRTSSFSSTSKILFLSKNKHRILQFTNLTNI